MESLTDCDTIINENNTVSVNDNETDGEVENDKNNSLCGIKHNQSDRDIDDDSIDQEHQQPVCSNNHIHKKQIHLPRSASMQEQSSLIAVGRKISKSSMKEFDERSEKLSSLLVTNESLNDSRQKKSYSSIEKSNTVSLMKLVVKELIENSMKTGRTIDSSDQTLKHFFILLEMSMKHSLKVRRGLLGVKKELWNVLELVERFDSDASDITSSIRNLPSAKTPIGKARAWIRMALMKKKLADYFRILLNHKEDAMSDFYESDALMLSDEATIIGGLLVGLNIIDCNLCMKEEDLDSQTNIIDFSKYLRDNVISYELDDNLPDISNDCKSSEDQLKLTAILDQKNYLEELNRHLNSALANSQKKTEQLKIENAVLRGISNYDLEEHKLTKTPSVQSENESVISGHTKEANSNTNHDNDWMEIRSPDMEEKIAKEMEMRIKIEKELNLQKSLLNEAETARHLLERDILEKQDTVISLRKQLEEVKDINLQMYSKLQECEVALKSKNEQIVRLEQKSTSMANSLAQLESKYTQSEKKRSALEITNQRLSDELSEREQKRLSVESDLKCEKKLQSTYQQLIDEQQEQITALQAENETYRGSWEQFQQLKSKYAFLEKKCSDYELSLEEIGMQLQDSKLEVDDLKENSGRLKEAVWLEDKEAKNCAQCKKPFSVGRRKHHCRNCGGIYCNECSNYKMPLPSSANPVRVCDSCHTFLLQRYAAT